MAIALKRLCAGSYFCFAFSHLNAKTKVTRVSSLGQGYVLICMNDERNVFLICCLATVTLKAER